LSNTLIPLNIVINLIIRNLILYIICILYRIHIIIVIFLQHIFQIKYKLREFKQHEKYHLKTRFFFCCIFANFWDDKTKQNKKNNTKLHGNVKSSHYINICFWKYVIIYSIYHYDVSLCLLTFELMHSLTGCMVFIYANANMHYYGLHYLFNIAVH
jgi:hypothetical protein